jgi:biotin-(acetyl-CoA carboxylase) ligase/methylase of polypeptide subunit release factors
MSTVDREIEITQGEALRVAWQAYGLPALSLLIPATVYPPREDSALLDRVLAGLGPGRGRHLFEIGCGSGAISISAAIRGWRVSSCDVHPLAVAASRGNAADHGFEASLSIREGGPGEAGDWNPSTGADVIAWNLPYLEPTEAQLGPLEDAALIGHDESGQLLQHLTENPSLLRPGGIVLLLHSSNRMGDGIPSAWRRAGWATRIQRETVLGDERLSVIACWRPFELAPQEILKVCDSTNVTMLDADLGIGSLLRTESQPGGKGQHGRHWVDSPGGFMGTWNLPPDSIGGGAEHLQLAAGIAVLDAFSCALHLPLPSHGWPHIAALADIGLRLEHPNDVWLNESKLGGILAEGRTQGDQVRVVLGIGINRWGPDADVPTAGWADLFEMDADTLSPMLHASMASLLEVHPLLVEITREAVSTLTSHAGARE